MVNSQFESETERVLHDTTVARFGR